jgi:PAS domain S-box-containing protein
MQMYFFSANLLTLIAFLLGLGDFSKGSQRWRLLPLFLLATSQSLSLIISSLEVIEASSTALAALGVFSATCLVWALVNTTNLSGLWRRLAWLGLGAALLLSIMPLIPTWPIPPQIHGLTIATFGTPIILSSLNRVSWLPLAAPVLLSVANFLSLLEFSTASWLVALLAYGLLVCALHWESLQAYRGRQQASQVMAQQALDLSQERQRLLEVSEIISAVPGLEQSMPHLVRSMAHVTHADQSAIFALDVEIIDQVRLIAIYSPERPVYLTSYDEVTFKLADCPPLQKALLEQKQHLLSPDQHKHNLESLYGLWNESRVGPTLIQPLIIQGRSIGALILGNPVTHQPMSQEDKVLCRSLASQMATMTEAFRRYLDLELRTELRGAAGPLQDPGESMLKIAPAAEPETASSVSAPLISRPNQPRGGVPPALATPAIEPIEAREVTEKKNKTDSAESFNDYVAILETVEEGVVVSNKLGQVQLVNKAAERILGKARQDLLGQPIGTIYGEIASGAKIEDLAAAFSRRNQPLPTFVEHDDRTIQGQLIPWRNGEKEWLGIIAIFSDVTSKVKADQARNDFITALSRVLRGPLTLIKGYAELMTNGLSSNQLEGEYSPEQLHIQQIIHSSVERVVEVLDNAIQISVQNKNKIVPRLEQVDVPRLIDDVLRELTSLARVREIKLVREVKGELPFIVADRVHLYRILENLLSNACRFTPPGGRVTLRAWVRNVRVGNMTHPQLILAVADNGVGIPQTELKRIFEPFYQLNNQQPGEERGMGMGLTVVRELVEMHGGQVWVESSVGEGSVFQVALPIGRTG